MTKALANRGPRSFGQKLARRLHTIVDAVFGGDLVDVDAPPIAGRIFGEQAIDDSPYREALTARLKEQERERREMAVIHEARYILQAQAGVAGNYVSVSDLAGHFANRRGLDRVELERILAFRGEPYFERLDDRLYLKGHVNG